MKKLFIAAMALATIVSCSKENEVVIAPVGGETALLSVSLKAAGDMTRAEVGSYEYGLPAENLIDNATFYFFDSNGGAYTVDAEKGNMVVVNSKDLTANTTKPAENIEAYSKVILTLKAHKATPPAKMVALINVANPKTYANTNLEDLQKLNTTLKSGDHFVMSNSVYDGDQDVVVATEILPENIFTTPDPATGVNPGDVYVPEGVEPVKIYVERVAAKVRVNLNDTTLYPVYDAEGKEIADTFVKVLGWDVTNASNDSYLLKSYAEATKFTSNNPTFFRSHWANTIATALPTNNLTFNAIKGANVATGYAYYHENTLNEVNADGWFNANKFDGATKASQLVVAAQLVDAKGAAKEFAKWYGEDYPNGNALKAAMINNAAKQIFVKDEENSTDAETVYKGISTSDVTFYQIASSTEYNPASWDGDRRYEVRVKADAETVYYTATKGDDGKLIPFAKTADVDAILAKIEPAMIWTTGYTYYYTMINHFGDADGIVRNHLYDVNVVSFNGLGTPVYDPTEIIIPEEPIEQEPYHLTAQINVLSWALVSQNVELGK